MDSDHLAGTIYDTIKYLKLRRDKVLHVIGLLEGLLQSQQPADKTPPSARRKAAHNKPEA